MQRFAAGLAAFLFLVAPAPPAVAQQAQSPNAFGVWRLECVPPGNPNRPPNLAPGARFCMLGQLVTTDPERRQVVLAATVDFYEGVDAPALRFRLASAMRHESGIGLKIDELAEMRLPVTACDQRVCVAAGRLTAEVQARIESGRAAEVNFLMADGRTLRVPLSLTGFREGMAALREVQGRP